MIVTALNCVLKVPQYLPQEQRFDIRVLVRIKPFPSQVWVKIRLKVVLMMTAVKTEF